MLYADAKLLWSSRNPLRDVSLKQVALDFTRDVEINQKCAIEIEDGNSSCYMGLSGTVSAEEHHHEISLALLSCGNYVHTTTTFWK